MSRVTTGPIASPGQSRVHLPPQPDTGRTVSAALAAVATVITIDLNRAIRGLSAPRRAERQRLAEALRATIAGGERPMLRVAVIGFDGLHVHVFAGGMSGAIAHTRTRRRAREIARPALASVLDVDPYAFDLEISGA